MIYRYYDPAADAEAWYVGQEMPDRRYRVEMAAEVWPDATGDLESIDLDYEVYARDEEEAREKAVDRYFEDLSEREKTGEIYDHPGEYEVKEVWCYG